MTDELKADLEELADEHGEIAGDRPTVTVEYETRHGNTRTREGEVWRVSDGGTFDDGKIRFSANAGEDDEDPYFIRLRHGNAKLFSISMASATETELGPVTDVAVDGLENDDTEDDVDPLAAFEEPDEIEEGMELTEDGDRVYLIKSINGDDATVQIWNDGRRGRRERMPVEGLQNDYESGELVIA